MRTPYFSQSCEFPHKQVVDSILRMENRNRSSSIHRSLMEPLKHILALRSACVVISQHLVSAIAARNVGPGNGEPCACQYYFCVSRFRSLFPGQTAKRLPGKSFFRERTQIQTRNLHGGTCSFSIHVSFEGAKDFVLKMHSLFSKSALKRV